MREPDPSLESLVAWCMYASGVRLGRDGQWRTRWVRGRHLVYLASRLVALYRGEIRRLAISFPPRHGKSHLVSRLAPCWWLGRDPRARVVVCSYSERMARKMTEYARDRFAEAGEAAFGVTTSRRSAATDWKVYRENVPTGGGVRGIGKGGGLTGDDVDFLCCDDLFKDAHEANNAGLRAAAIEWWESVPWTRFEPWTKGLVMGTRWHEEDVIGWLMAKQKRGELAVPWEFVNVPAVCDQDDDPLNRAIGESLWPERFGEEFYRELKAEASPRVWAALYQGRPTPLEGALFKRHWFSYFEERGDYFVGHEVRVPSRGLLRYVTLDPAFSKKTSADHSAIAAWALDLTNNRLFLLEMVRERLEPHELAGAVRGVMTRNGAEIVYAERNNLKETQMQVIRSVVPMIEIPINIDKVSHAMPVTSHLATGRLLFRRNAPWLAALENELLMFRADAAEDDQVDAVSYGVHVANEHASSGLPPRIPDLPPPGRPGPDDDDRPRGRPVFPQLPRPR